MRNYVITLIIFLLIIIICIICYSKYICINPLCFPLKKKYNDFRKTVSIFAKHKFAIKNKGILQFKEAWIKHIYIKHRKFLSIKN